MDTSDRKFVKRMGRLVLFQLPIVAFVVALATFLWGCGIDRISEVECQTRSYEQELRNFSSELRPPGEMGETEHEIFQEIERLAKLGERATAYFAEMSSVLDGFRVDLPVSARATRLEKQHVRLNRRVTNFRSAMSARLSRLSLRLKPPST